MNSASIKDIKKEEEPNQKNLENQLTIIKSITFYKNYLIMYLKEHH